LAAGQSRPFGAVAVQLWIFETETLRLMLADAKHVYDNNKAGDVQDEAALMYSAIRTELRSRNAHAERN
jgi:hypothetical protein